MLRPPSSVAVGLGGRSGRRSPGPRAARADTGAGAGGRPSASARRAPIAAPRRVRCWRLSALQLGPGRVVAHGRDGAERRARPRISASASTTGSGSQERHVHAPAQPSLARHSRSLTLRHALAPCAHSAAPLRPAPTTATDGGDLADELGRQLAHRFGRHRLDALDQLGRARSGGRTAAAGAPSARRAPRSFPAPSAGRP